MMRLLLAVISLCLFALPIAAKQTLSPGLSDATKSETIEALRRDLDSGNYLEAEEPCKKLLELDPKSPEGIAARGALKLLKKDYRGTIEDCSKALELKPNMPYFTRLALNFRYHAYIKLGDYKNAFASCVQCLPLRRDVCVANDAVRLSKMLGRADDVKKYFELAAEWKIAEDQEIRDREALFRNTDDPKKVDDVIAAVGAMLKKDPDDTQARFIRVVCYRNKRQWLARSKESANSATTKKQMLSSELADVNNLLETDFPLETQLLSERLVLDKELGRTDLAKRDQNAVDRQALLDRLKKAARAKAEAKNERKEGMLNLLK
jgi:tetratricopeptide (TPR) repeat protein